MSQIVCKECGQVREPFNLGFNSFFDARDLPAKDTRTVTFFRVTYLECDLCQERFDARHFGEVERHVSQHLKEETE